MPKTWLRPKTAHGDVDEQIRKGTGMKKKNMIPMNIQFFADGGDGEEGGNGGQEGNQNAGGGTGAQTTGASYTQDQLDAIVEARETRATNSALRSFFQQQGMSSEEITQAIADYKTARAASQPDVKKLQSQLDEANKKIEQSNREKIATKKGVNADDLDYVLFKAGKLVDEKTDFEKALDHFLKDNPKYARGGRGHMKVSFGSQNSGQEGQLSVNEKINDAIRNAVKR
ncbi:hypothetical protein [Anaerostipes sp.]|uniref:hypothetical protein n=1 Tax=Anaerostipes sp. TaxID=1872530 RepID=UPI003996BBF8